MIFTIAGVGIKVISDSNHCIEVLEKKIGPSNHSSTFDFKLQLRIHLGSIPTIHVNPILQWHRTQRMYGQIINGRLWLTDGYSKISLDYEHCQCDFWLDEHSIDDALFFNRTFLLLPILELLRTQKKYFVHGALIKHLDEGYLILGQSGSGKSTLVRSWIKQQRNFVSDDHVLVDIRPSGELIGHCFEKEFRTLDRFDHPNIYPSEKDSKHALAYKHINGHIDFCTIDHVCVLNQSASKSSVLDQMIQDNPMLLIDTSLSKDHFACLSNIVSTKPIKQIVFSRHLNPVEHLAEELINQLKR